MSGAPRRMGLHIRVQCGILGRPCSPRSAFGSRRPTRRAMIASELLHPRSRGRKGAVRQLSISAQNHHCEDRASLTQRDWRKAYAGAPRPSRPRLRGCTYWCVSANTTPFIGLLSLFSKSRAAFSFCPPAWKKAAAGTLHRSFPLLPARSLQE